MSDGTFAAKIAKRRKEVEERVSTIGSYDQIVNGMASENANSASSKENSTTSNKIVDVKVVKQETTTSDSPEKEQGASSFLSAAAKSIPPVSEKTLQDSVSSSTSVELVSNSRDRMLSSYKLMREDPEASDKPDVKQALSSFKDRVVDRVSQDSSKKGLLIGGAILGGVSAAIVGLFLSGVIQEAASRYEGGNLAKLMSRLARTGSLKHRRSKKYFLVASDGSIVHPDNLWDVCQFSKKLKVNGTLMQVIDFDMRKDSFTVEVQGVGGVLRLFDVVYSDNVPAKYFFRDPSGVSYLVEIGETYVEVK